MNFSKKTLTVTVVILAAVVSFFLFWSRPGTGELESLARRLFEMAKAGDVEGCLAHVDPNYDYGGEDYARIEGRASNYINSPGAREYELKDLEAELLSDEEGRAHYTIMIPAMGRKLPQRLILIFRKIGDRWMVTGYEIPERRF